MNEAKIRLTDMRARVGSGLEGDHVGHRNLLWAQRPVSDELCDLLPLDSGEID